MSSNKATILWLGSGALGLLIVAALAGRWPGAAAPALTIEANPSRIPADGFSSSTLLIRATNGSSLHLSQVTLEIVEGGRRARIEAIAPLEDAVQAVVRAGILPGPVVLEARATGFASTRARIETVLDSADRAGDGTPDFLRLGDESDRGAFRRWFIFLAESQFYRSPDRLPAEVNDCAALLRFAYREALREHDGGWASELNLDAVPAIPSVRKYQYPFTPLGAGLFRVKPGSFRLEDLGNGAFAQFADAQTLQWLNTHFISRDIRQAEPGDLLFFRQLEQDLPFHAMVFLGRSHFDAEPGDWVVYHTGPLGDSKGEVRRVRLEELLRHPSPRWRPLPGNSNFLGVYRWNILRGAD